jgi:hypothetical protein
VQPILQQQVELQFVVELLHYPLAVLSRGIEVLAMQASLQQFNYIIRVDIGVAEVLQGVLAESGRLLRELLIFLKILIFSLS